MESFHRVPERPMRVLGEDAMLSKPVAAVLVVAGILVAAFAGGYVAQHARGSSPPQGDLPGLDELTPEAPPNAAPAGGGGAPAAGGAGGQAPAGGGASAPKVPRLRPPTSGQAANTPSGPAPASGTAPSAATGQPAAFASPTSDDLPRELTVPAGQIIGLQLAAPVSTSTAKVEDPVEARITQDVASGAQLAIPAGTRILGSVSLVDKGGKVKEPAKLGIVFHTLALNPGPEVKVKIDPLIYEASPGPAPQSTKKIGAGAAAGVALGWLLGGKSGAIKGGAIGAGAGTALNQLTNESVATLPAGAQARVILQEPVKILVKK